ncbi:hypothetical protein D3C83_151360 [compost metagenome]
MIDIYDLADDTLTRSVGPGARSAWTSNPTVDTVAPNILATAARSEQLAPIEEIDPDSGTKQTLPGVAGFGVDSAD